MWLNMTLDLVMLLVAMPALAFVPVDDDMFCKSLLNKSVVEQGNCAIKEYRPRDTAQCLDILSQNMRYRGRRASIYFLGDSRMRQQFQSFLKMVPTEHFVRTTKVVDLSFNWPHEDVVYYSELFDVSITFQWMPIINQNLTDQLHKWTSYSLDNAPTLVVMGIGVHHMTNHYFRDDKAFERNLTKLEPTLRRLAQISTVVWWNQFFTLENLGSFNGFEFKVNPDKVHYYNQVSRRILADSNVLIWDSSTYFAMEYLRGCRIIKRYDGRQFFNCQDGLHPGFYAIYRATQYLYNYMCNRLLLQSDSPSISISANVCCDETNESV